MHDHPREPDPAHPARASLHALTADSAIVALTVRQPLASVEAGDVPVAPPTYPPARETGTHRFDTPYPVNATRDGVHLCELDSVASQANRMEAAFTAELADVVPRHVVRAGRFERDLTALPHRIADAAIRASALAPRIRAAFEAFDAGDAAPMARLAPTSLVYGAWDSRDTRVRIPRAIASAIRAHDVSVLTRSSVYSGAFAQDALGLDDRAWKRAAGAGLAPAPRIDRAGGILVHGGIVHSASIVLAGLRGCRTSDAGEGLPVYLLGLALGGLVTTGRRYHLRSGCVLVPAGAPEWRAVIETGERIAVAVDAETVVGELRAAARAWSAVSGVPLGGPPEVHHFDPARARAMLEAKGAAAAEAA